MELFFTTNIEGDTAWLDEQESTHCTRVLRHAAGDEIHFTDGRGILYTGRIVDKSGKQVVLHIIDSNSNYMKRGYYLHMAVAPPKNPDRFEWFLEKAVELGIDEITPLEGEHSQKRSFNMARGERLIMAAMKQSLKTTLPILNPITKASALIEKYSNSDDFQKLIGHCRDGEKSPITTLLGEPFKVLILIGPEGDFSVSEIALAQKCGFKPFSLGESRLRTETAALTAVTAVYLKIM
ncbi:16S rRNA (uracil(1498)-N(3))-methyltransferase [Bacteroidota bacterium]